MATPVEWLNEFQVNTGTADTPAVGAPHIVGLSNGNFLVAWEESGTTGVATQAGTDIVGKIFDAEGNLVRDSYRLNSGRTADNERDFDIAATNDGGFILVFVDNDISTPGDTDVIYQRHNAAGNSLGTDVILTETTANFTFSNPQITVNQQNNTSVLQFQNTQSGDNGIFLRTIDANGVVTSTGSVNDDPASDEDQGDIAMLTNGNVVSVWTEEAGGDSVQYRIQTATGASVTTAANVDATGRGAQVTALTNGGFVVAYENYNVGTGGAITAAIYNSAGAIQSFATVANTANSENEPDVIALPDGDFVVVWDDDTANTLLARRYNADGTTDGSTFTVENVGTTSPSISVTGDGRILFAWEDQSGGNIHSSIWDPRPSTVNGSDYDNNTRSFLDTNVLTSLVTSSTVNGTSASDTILGQGGNDVLNGGSGADTIEGGAGADIINGGFGTDTIDAGSGNDTIIVSNGHNIDNVNGGSGIDTLDLSAITNASGAVNIDLLAGSWSGLGGTRTISSIETIEGTQEDDTVTSTFGTQTIDLNGGNDTLIHGDGQFIDDIDGGSGIDLLDLSDELTQGVTINENAGTWTGLGGTRDFSGFENVNGTQADDNIYVDNGVSTINGNDGDDIIRAGFSEDNVNGGSGNDTFVVVGNEFIDNTDGGSGSDTLDHSALSSLYSGADVNFATGIITTSRASGGTATVTSIETYLDNDQGNTITDRSGGMTIDAGGGNDTVIENVSGGTDKFLLGLGDDLLRVQNGGFSGDVFDGGAGIDTADFSFLNYNGDNAIIDLQAGTLSGNGQSETLSNFENVIGSQGAETIIGTTGDNEIDGLGGGDTINTGGGNDTVFGRGGADNINLGDGSDFALGGSANDTIRGGTGADNVQGGAGADILFGDGGSDTILGGSGGDTIEGGTGNDTIDGGNAADVINGGAGNDIITGGGFTDTLRGGDNLDTISGGGSADEIYGDGGGDTLFGNNGADYMEGGSGNDTMNGGAGNDEMRGGTGADEILGSTGDDRLYGDGGGDTFQFRANHGNDRIFDFEDGTDIIEFNIGSVNSIGDLSFTNVFAGVDIDYGTGNIRVLGLSDSDFSSADFVFL